MIGVLVVDDQAPFRDAARMVVELTEGFELIGEAETGRRSVEMATGLRPDLVLMDINLPDIDGFEATRRILAASPRPPVVVVLSTYEAVDYADRALASGAAAFVSKSVFTPEELRRTWDEVGAQIS